MTCDEFCLQLVDALTDEEIERLVAAHGDCRRPDCIDAVATARALATPLSTWSDLANESDRRPALAARVLCELVGDAVMPVSFAGRQLVQTAWESSRTNRVTVAVATAIMAVLGLFEYLPASTSLTAVASGRSAAGQASREIDAAAYLEQTEQWIVEARLPSIDDESLFDVSFDRSAAWIESNLVPFAQSLQRAGERAADRLDGPAI